MAVLQRAQTVHGIRMRAAANGYVGYARLLLQLLPDERNLCEKLSHQRLGHDPSRKHCRRRLEKSVMSDHIGISTGRHPDVVNPPPERQGPHSTDRLTPSGSGSVDFSDCVRTPISGDVESRSREGAAPPAGQIGHQVIGSTATWGAAGRTVDPAKCHRSK